MEVSGVTFERREAMRRGLGRVMAAAKALGAGEIEAVRREIAEVRRLDVFSSDVMVALEQVGESLQKGQTRRAAVQLQTAAAALREELSRFATRPVSAAPPPAVPATHERAVTQPSPDPEPAPPIAVAPPPSFMPDAARALALAELLGKAEPPHTKQRLPRPTRAAYVVTAGLVGAILLVRALDWGAFLNAPPPRALDAPQPRATVAEPPVAQPPVAEPPVAEPPIAETSGQASAPPPAAQAPTLETDVPIALPTAGALPTPEQRADVARRANEAPDGAGAEPRVVTARPRPAQDAQRAAAPPPSEPPANLLREPVEELPIAPVRIDPPPAPANAPTAPTTPSDAVQIERALGEYRQAYERLDARGARGVWPGVNERALARAFAGLESQDLNFDRCDVNVGDGSATAVCNGTARYVPKVGSKEPRVEPRRWTFSLRKSANGWEIDNVETGRQ